MFYVCFRLLCQVALRVYFRRIEVEGEPDAQRGPVVFVANHTNSLIDPLLLMIAARRRITLTAKSALWSNLLLRLLRWGLGIISFERRGAGSPAVVTRANVASLARCRATLESGGALCVFPEGISHSDPQMRPFRRGAARIALDFASRDDGGAALRVVPIGLFYTDKSRPRSAVWVRFGEAIDVREWREAHPAGNDGELTAEIRRRLERLTLSFEDEREARLLPWAARLADADEESSPSLLFGRIQRVQWGWRKLAATDRTRADSLMRLLSWHRDALESRGLTPGSLPTAGVRPSGWLDALRRLELLIVGAPLGMSGLAVQAPPLLAVCGVARGLSRDEDHWATNSVYPAFVLFPTWGLALIAASGWWAGPWAFVPVGCALYAAALGVLWLDEASRTADRVRGRLVVARMPHGASLVALTSELGAAATRLEGEGRAAESEPGGDRPDAMLESQLQVDAATVSGCLEALARIETEFVEAGAGAAAERRGYFTPDEDDGVRRLLVAFRGLRGALWELIRRYWDYERLGAGRDRTRGFLIGYAAALISYGHCLELIRHCEGSPRLRAKLNEPDERFGLGPGFFEEILEANTSWRNARALTRAERFWRRERSRLRELGIDRDPALRALAAVVAQQEGVVRRTLWSVLARRLRYDWRALWRSAAHPLGRLAYAFTAFCGARLAEMRVQDAPHAIDGAVIEAVGPTLRSGDLVFVRSEARLTASLLPGFWSHVALFLGDEGPSGPAAPWGSVVEARAPGVGVRPLQHCLEADHLLVLRPRLSVDERRSAVRAALSHVGKAYDFEMDFGATTRLVCTELVYRAYHGRGALALRLVRRMGRPTLSCDDLVGQLLASADLPFDLVWLGLRFADGRHHRIRSSDAAEWLDRIAAGARPGASGVADSRRTELSA